MALRHKKNDTCTIGTMASGANGEPRGSFAESAATRFAFRRGFAFAESGGNSLFPATDALAFFDQGTSIDDESRVTLTQLNGAAVSPNEVYKVVGAPFVPIAGDVGVKLMRVTGAGSDQ